MSDISDFFRKANIGQDGKPNNPEDPEWQTPIGEVVLEELLVRPRKPIKLTNLEEDDDKEGIPEDIWNKLVEATQEDEEVDAEAEGNKSGGSDQRGDGSDRRGDGSDRSDDGSYRSDDDVEQ